MESPHFDPRLQFAIGIVRRCLGGEGIELQQKVLKYYEPTLHRCHDNVREFVEKFPECRHVRGFLVANRQPIADTTLVIAHSVVGAPDGSLNDITPSALEVSYPFVRHTGTLDEFERIAAAEPFMIEVPNAILRNLSMIP
jgi:hypothetical protein